MTKLNKSLKKVKKWQLKTFPQKNKGIGNLRHLKVEVDEVIHEIENGINSPALIEEFCDILILWNQARFKNDISLKDISTGIDLKLEKLGKRAWEKPDKEGKIFHKK